MADADSPASSRLFISYRREDSSGHVLALLPALRRHFGADHIFKDTDNIPPGADFLKFIKRELESCSVLLAIIGRDWLTVQDPRLKHRRLDNPEDFLRVEVASALKNERIRVIPVLVERATMPAVEDLPPDLAELPYRNAVELSDARWESDVQRLIQAVEQACAESAAKPEAASQRPELLDLHRRRAREIAAHLTSAREALEARDYEGALWACEKALLLDPQRSEALELLDRARRASDEQKIETSLEQARQALSRRDIGEASDFIDQALAIDNTSEAALTLRKEMLALRRERERERERARVVRAATDRAQASLEEEDFEAAVRHADDALAVDPAAAEPQNIRLKALAALDQRRRQREHKRRAQQAVADARGRFAAGEHEPALQLLREFSPGHHLVAQTLQELQKEFETIQRGRRHVDELMRGAADALAAGQFQDAISRLSEVAAMAADRPEVAALLHEAKARQATAVAAEGARRQADARLAEASGKVRQHDYRAARELVEAARRHDAQHPEIEPWLRRIETALAEQAAAARRAKAIGEALDQAKQSFNNGDLESAIRQADAALAVDPTLSGAQALRDNAGTALAERQAREEHERLATQTIERARSMFDRSQHKTAIDLLEDFRPPHALVSEALDRLREQLRNIEQRRRQEEEEAARQRLELERAASERRRADAIRKILARVQERLAGEDFANAVADADELLSLDPDSVQARDLRAAAAEGLQQQIERQEERQEEERLAREAAEQAALDLIISRIEGHLAAGQLDAGEQLLAEAQRTLPASPAFGALRNRATELREREALRTRATRVQRLLADAQAAFEAKAFRTAKRAAKAALELEPDNHTARSLLTSATQELHAAIRAFWFTRRVGGLGALAIVIISTTIALYYYGQTSTPSSQLEADQISSDPVSPPPSDERIGVPAPPDSSPTRESAAPPVTPPVSKSPTKEEATQQRLELLRKTALEQLRKGQRTQALKTAAEGLQLEPNDPALGSFMDSLLSEAQKAAQRAKNRASNAGAATLAQKTFSEAVKLEDEATRSREAKGKETVIQSFWKVADQFDLAARQAANEQARLERQADEARKKEIVDEQEKRTAEKTPPVREQAKPPAVNRIEEEKARIEATLRRYENAYDNLDAEAVKAVYSGAPSDLGRTFAQYEFYRLEMVVERIDVSADATSATAICRLSHYFKPKGAKEEQQRTRPAFTLQKRGETWIIVQQRF